MTVNMNAIENFVDLLESLTTWAQYTYAVSMLMKGLRFLPDTSIERDGKVLDND
jgi:hypothetical protein